MWNWAELVPDDDRPLMPKVAGWALKIHVASWFAGLIVKCVWVLA
jgi:hypothetical protein